MASLLLLVDATLNLGDTLLPVAEIADCTAAILFFFFFFLNFFKFFYNSFFGLWLGNNRCSIGGNPTLD